jgi:hypothetical protein
MSTKQQNYTQRLLMIQEKYEESRKIPLSLKYREHFDKIYQELMSMILAFYPQLESIAQVRYLDGQITISSESIVKDYALQLDKIIHQFSYLQKASKYQ